MTINITKSEINEIADDIGILFNNSAKDTFSRKQYTCTKTMRNSSFTKPWFGPQCNKARRRYHIARRKYFIHKNDQYRCELNRASKHYKQTINTYTCKHKTRNERKLRELHSRRPRDFWKILNNLNANSTPENSPDVETFYNYFKSVNLDKNYDDSDNFDMPDANVNQNEILNCKISKEEIIKMIDKSNNSKAASPQDFIYNEYLKSTKEFMVPILCVFF